MSAERDTVLEKLWACAAACEYCAEKCLEGGAAADTQECIRSCRDCADICILTARFVMRDSRHSRHVMDECLEICNECAQACEQLAGHDGPCAACARKCRECIEACLAFQG